MIAFLGENDTKRNVEVAGQQMFVRDNTMSLGLSYTDNTMLLGLSYAMCINDEQGSFQRRLWKLMSMVHTLKHAIQLPHLTYGSYLANPSLLCLIHRFRVTSIA